MVRAISIINKLYVMVLGNTMDSHKTFLDKLTISPKLREESSLKDSDVVIAFVPIASRAGTDILAAMGTMPEGKPIVLVVLHHTFNLDYVAPDSKFCVNNERVFAVDCLFHEDQGLLTCPRNDDAIRVVKKHLTGDDMEVDSSLSSFKSNASTGVDDLAQSLGAVGCVDTGVDTAVAINKFYVMVLGNTMDVHKTFLHDLTISTKLCEVSTLNDSDVIIAFVPIASRADIDISAAMGKIPEGKPVVLVVLHHTFDPNYVAPDSRLCVNNDRVFAVDCLFHEDQGLLRCLRNYKAIRAVKEHLKIDKKDGGVSCCLS